MARLRRSIRAGAVRIQASTLSSSSFVLTARSMTAACCVLIASRPPRSATRSARHCASALPSVVLMSITRPPRPFTACFSVVRPCFEYVRGVARRVCAGFVRGVGWLAPDAAEIAER